ncbi:Uncharacterized protein Adt_46389 [Abeliophyllum distichum]|uniref:Uncharacterized protein n=1 Tax=Abeliophyllum distichum TaxID=126358 RepID=A0ABD1P259_9LAMI
MEEEAPETDQTTDLALGNLGGFGLGSTPNSTAANLNPFGVAVLNRDATPAISTFTMPTPSVALVVVSWAYLPVVLEVALLLLPQVVDLLVWASGGGGFAAAATGGGFAAAASPGGGFAAAAIGGGGFAGAAAPAGGGFAGTATAGTGFSGGGFGALGNQQSGGFGALGNQQGGGFGAFWQSARWWEWVLSIW